MTQQNASKRLLRNDSKIELLDINTLSSTKIEKCKIYDI